MPNVYIIGASIQTGGAYMAYHIGRLLANHYGYAPVDVHLYETGEMLFPYDITMKVVTPQDMEKSIRPDDIMVVNPSYSQFLFGLRLPGKKIMYVQDFRTFTLLDCHCDLYVGVSQLVARYVHALYGLSIPVIPAFIDTHGASGKPWQERPEGSALVFMKNPSREHHIALEYIRRRLEKTHPQIDLSQVLEGRSLTHPEFMERLGSVRYFFNLSLAEGFGLVPLEAMAMGALVTGVDGLGGRDYIRPGQNALTGSIRDLRRVPEIVARAFTDMALAEKCVENGMLTASHYTHDAFKAAWLPQLTQLTGKQPHGA